MKRTICAVIGGTMLLVSGCTKIAMPILIPPTPSADLPYNQPQSIRQEILDPNLVVLIGKAHGMSAWTIARFKVVQGQDSYSVDLEHTGIGHGAIVKVSDQLKAYVEGRLQGHTKEFMLSSFANRTKVSTIPDPDLRVLLQKEQALPASGLKKSETGIYTNKAGQVAWKETTYSSDKGTTKTNEVVHIPKADETGRWTSYLLVDGEIAWRYVLTFSPDNSLRNIVCQKMDAKELDPRYAGIIKEVNAEAKAELEKQGIEGKFGSVHTYWQIKKEKLKAKGIEWRSPAELNRNICYD